MKRPETVARETLLLSLLEDDVGISLEEVVHRCNHEPEKRYIPEATISSNLRRLVSEGRIETTFGHKELKFADKYFVRKAKKKILLFRRASHDDADAISYVPCASHPQQAQGDD